MKRMMSKVAAGLLMCLAASQALGARISDLTRLAGDQPNELVGLGLVVGLKGTGDGGDSMPAIRVVQGMLNRFLNQEAVAKELKNANNVAIVMVSVSVPSAGAHEGDKLDAKVASFSAKSLKGGRLFTCPLLGSFKGDDQIYGTVSGDLTLEDDANPCVATIRAGNNGGAKLDKDISMDNTSDGKFTLVLLSSAASFSNATAIADQINEDVTPQTDGKPAAVAVDATTVVVQIPKAELARPAQFIARVQQLQVPALPQTAKVVINSKKKSIVFTGDVELSPTMISQGDMTITVTAPNAPANPPGSQVNFMALDPAKQGGTKLKDLVETFNLMKLPADDRITIIKQLHDSGALRCQLEID